MLLSGLGILIDTAGISRVLINGAMGCDPPVVRISIKSSPKTFFMEVDNNVAIGPSIGVLNGFEPSLYVKFANLGCMALCWSVGKLSIY